MKLAPDHDNLAKSLAAARERKAVWCDQMAEAHVVGRHYVTYRREAEFWREAAKIALEGNLMPLSFEKEEGGGLEIIP